MPADRAGLRYGYRSKDGIPYSSDQRYVKGAFNVVRGSFVACHLTIGELLLYIARNVTIVGTVTSPDVMSE